MEAEAKCDGWLQGGGCYRVKAVAAGGLATGRLAPLASCAPPDPSTSAPLVPLAASLSHPRSHPPAAVPPRPFLRGLRVDYSDKVSGGIEVQPWPWPRP